MILTNLQARRKTHLLVGRIGRWFKHAFEIFFIFSLDEFVPNEVCDRARFLSDYALFSLEFYCWLNFVSFRVECMRLDADAALEVGRQPEV